LSYRRELRFRPRETHTLRIETDHQLQFEYEISISKSGPVAADLYPYHACASKRRPDVDERLDEVSSVEKTAPETICVGTRIPPGHYVLAVGGVGESAGTETTSPSTITVTVEGQPTQSEE
jgi:hypothetical protein